MSADHEYPEDKKIRKIESDVAKFKTEQVSAERELDGIDARLDQEIERLKTEASARRSE